MSDAWLDFVADLQEAPEELTTKPSKNIQKFDCPTCAGTGLYRGVRVHQDKRHCFSCKGLGYFKTDPRKLAANREKAAERKRAQKAADLANFDAQFPGVRAFVMEAAAWSSFAGSLAEQLNSRGMLSDRQVQSVRSMMAKAEARKAAKENGKADVDLTKIREMFETAVGNGYKRPTYRAEGVIISRAPNSGANPGALYIKNEDGAYRGKILGTTFMPTYGAEGTADALLAIAGDPLAAALKYGQRTGRCACCGKQLTNHTSIDAGIGPICKDKWGL